MPQPELSLLFIEPLNRIGVRYLVSGSVAAILYGEPRLTHDVDLILFLPQNEIGMLTGAFLERWFYVPPPEVIGAEITRGERGHFNVIHLETGFKADFYPAGSDPLHAWAFRNARRMELRGTPVMVAPPEYVIVRKLEYYRDGGSEKHMRDIQAMLAVSGQDMDRDVLHEWVRTQGVIAQWEKIKS